VPEYLLVRIAVPLILAIVALVVWRSVLLVPPALLLGYALPILWVRMRRKQRNRDFNDQLADTLALTSASMRCAESARKYSLASACPKRSITWSCAWRARTWTWSSPRSRSTRASAAT
jgi:hypothetical protein